MNADELSELAECLEDACAAAIARGMRIAPRKYNANSPDECCPFGALLSVFHGFPGCEQAAAVLEIDSSITSDFMSGFDGGLHRRSDAFALGRLFRAEYVGK